MRTWRITNAVLLAGAVLVWGCCHGGPKNARPDRQSPQPLEQWPLEDPDRVSLVNPEEACFIDYQTRHRKVRLKLCNIHYHYPAEHGRGTPGQWAVPDCPGASTNNYPSPPQWGQKPPAPHHNGAHAPTQAPVAGDVIEIHYVYGCDDGRGPKTCQEIKNEAVASELSDCKPPLVVLAVWARVVDGPQTDPRDINPFSPFGGTEYTGSTTGAGRPTKPAYWRINAGCREVNIHDLDPDGHNAGKIKGHPSRPLQPVR